MHFDNEETSAILSAPPDPSAVQSICWNLQKIRADTYIHTLNGPLSRTTWVSRYQKGKTNLDFTGARDSEWQWHQLGNMQVCISLQTDNHASTHYSVFLQAGCPSCRPTNNVRALKAKNTSWRKEKLKPQNTDRRHNFNKSNCKILRRTFSTQNLNNQTLKVLLKYNPKCQTLTSD